MADGIWHIDGTHTPQAIRHMLYAGLLERVQRPRVIVENLVDHVTGQLAVIAQLAQRFDLRGIVRMAIICSDNQIVLSRVAENVIKIVIGLAGDVDSVFFKNIVRKRLAAPRETPREIVNRVRNPLRAHFDDADPELREALRNAVKYQRMERADNRQLEFGEARIIGEKIVGRKSPISRMNTDR